MKLYSDLKSYRPTGTLSRDGQFRSDDLRAVQLYDDPSTSYWLKEQIRRCFNCDICDALSDTHILLDLLEKRFATMTSGRRI